MMRWMGAPGGGCGWDFGSRMSPRQTKPAPACYGTVSGLAGTGKTRDRSWGVGLPMAPCLSWHRLTRERAGVDTTLDLTTKHSLGRRGVEYWRSSQIKARKVIRQGKARDLCYRGLEPCLCLALPACVSVRVIHLWQQSPRHLHPYCTEKVVLLQSAK